MYFLDSDFVETNAAQATETVPGPKWVLCVLCNVLVPSQLSVC